MKKSALRGRYPGLAFTTAILMVILAACSPKTPPHAEEPFPESGEVRDWAKSSTTRTFPADNLWEYVDGDAERYIQAEVVRTLTTD